MENPGSSHQWNTEFGFGASDRRFAYSRQASFHQVQEPRTPISIISNDQKKPLLCRTISSIDIPSGIYPLEEGENFSTEGKDLPEKVSFFLLVLWVFRVMRSGNRPMGKLFIMISLNVAYSTAELLIGLFTGRAGI